MEVLGVRQIVLSISQDDRGVEEVINGLGVELDDMSSHPTVLRGPVLEVI